MEDRGVVRAQDRDLAEALADLAADSELVVAGRGLVEGVRAALGLAAALVARAAGQGQAAVLVVVPVMPHLESG